MAGMKRYSKVERIRIVREHELSGRSAVAFCRDRGVSAGSLANWRKRYVQEEPVAAADRGTPPWIPVVVTRSAESPVRATGYVMAAEGFRLEVPRGFDPEETRVLWRMVSGAVEVMS